MLFRVYKIGHINKFTKKGLLTHFPKQPLFYEVRALTEFNPFLNLLTTTFFNMILVILSDCFLFLPLTFVSSTPSSTFFSLCFSSTPSLSSSYVSSTPSSSSCYVSSKTCVPGNGNFGTF